MGCCQSNDVTTKITTKTKQIPKKTDLENEKVKQPEVINPISKKPPTESDNEIEDDDDDSEEFTINDDSTKKIPQQSTEEKQPVSREINIIPAAAETTTPSESDEEQQQEEKDHKVHFFEPEMTQIPLPPPSASAIVFQEKVEEKEKEPILVRGDQNNLQLRTKFQNKFEAVAIGNQIFIHDVSGSFSTADCNRVLVRPLGFLGSEREEEMQSRSCSALAFSHDSLFIATATREGRISIWSTVTGEKREAFGFSASLVHVLSTNATTTLEQMSKIKKNRSRTNNLEEQYEEENPMNLLVKDSNNSTTSDVFKGFEVAPSLSKNFTNDNDNNNAAGATTSSHAAIHSIVWSRNDKYIFAGLANGTIQIWDCDSCALREDIPVIYNAHSSWVLALAVSENGKYLASGGIDETICIFDVTALLDDNNNNKPVAAVGTTTNEISLLHKIQDGHSGSVNCLVFAKDIKIESNNLSSSSSLSDQQEKDKSLNKKKFKHYCHLISGSSDKTIKCWDARTGKQRGETISGNIGGHSDSITFLDVSSSTSDGQNDNVSSTTAEMMTLVSVSQDRTLCKIDMKELFFQDIYYPNRNGNNNSERRASTIVSPDKQQQPSFLSVPQQYSPKSNNSAFGDSAFGIQIDATASTMSAITKSNIDRLRTGHKDNITGICMIPNSKVAVTSSLDELLKIWNVDTNTNHAENFSLGHATSSISACGGMSSVNNLFRGVSNTSSVVSASSPSRQVSNLSSTASAIAGLSSTPSPNRSGRGLLTAASAASLLSSQTAHGKTLKTLLADVQVKSRVYGVASSRDALVLAAGRMDGRTPLYAIIKGNPVGKRPLELEEKVVSMGFTQDGKEFVATDLQGDTTRFLMSTVLSGF